MATTTDNVPRHENGRSRFTREEKEAFRRRYMITAMRSGRIMDQQDILNMLSGQLGDYGRAAHPDALDHAELLLRDESWMRGHKGVIPARLVDELWFDVILPPDLRYSPNATPDAQPLYRQDNPYVAFKDDGPIYGVGDTPTEAFRDAQRFHHNLDDMFHAYITPEARQWLAEHGDTAEADEYYDAGGEVRLDALRGKPGYVRRWDNPDGTSRLARRMFDAVGAQVAKAPPEGVNADELDAILAELRPVVVPQWASMLRKAGGIPERYRMPSAHEGTVPAPLSVRSAYFEVAQALACSFPLERANTNYQWATDSDYKRAVEALCTSECTDIVDDRRLTGFKTAFIPRLYDIHDLTWGSVATITIGTHTRPDLSDVALNVERAHALDPHEGGTWADEEEDVVAVIRFYPDRRFVVSLTGEQAFDSDFAAALHRLVECVLKPAREQGMFGFVDTPLGTPTRSMDYLPGDPNFREIRAGKIYLGTYFSKGDRDWEKGRVAVTPEQYAELLEAGKRTYLAEVRQGRTPWSLDVPLKFKGRNTIVELERPHVLELLVRPLVNEHALTAESDGSIAPGALAKVVPGPDFDEALVKYGVTKATAEKVGKRLLPTLKVGDAVRIVTEDVTGGEASVFEWEVMDIGDERNTEPFSKGIAVRPNDRSPDVAWIYPQEGNRNQGLVMHWVDGPADSSARRLEQVKSLTRRGTKRAAKKGKKRRKNPEEMDGPWSRTYADWQGVEFGPWLIDVDFNDEMELEPFLSMEHDDGRVMQITPYRAQFTGQPFVSVLVPGGGTGDYEVMLPKEAGTDPDAYRAAMLDVIVEAVKKHP